MGAGVSCQTDVFLKKKDKPATISRGPLRKFIFSLFPGSVYFPREHDRHAITEAGTEHCYACHSHQEKMSW